MFDKVKVWQYGCVPDNLEAVLSDYDERYYPESKVLKQWGNLKNLRVRAHTKRGTVIEGSLPKYLHGSNLLPMTRRSTQDAIESISDIMHTPIKESRVCSFEIAQNMIMKTPVINYLSAFAWSRFLKRSDFSDRETITFHNQQRALCFYDKVKECKSKKQEIPDIFQGKNILRYECRFQRRLGNQFGKKDLILENLYDDIFYMKPINKWKDEYFLIQKIKRERAIAMTGQRDYLLSLAFYGLQNIGGVDVAMDLIREARQRNEIDKKMKQRLRNLTREIIEAKGVTVENDAGDCIQELDSKVMQAANFYR